MLTITRKPGSAKSRAAGGMLACAEFKLRKTGPDSVLFSAGGREEELRIIRHYPAEPVDWSLPIFDQFTLFGQRLGPMDLDFPGVGTWPAELDDFAQMQLPVETPNGTETVTAIYDVAQARTGEPVDIMWTRYDAYYRPHQPLVNSFQVALFRRYGEPSITMTNGSRMIYVWAHDTAGKLLSGPEENVRQCYQGQKITVRTPVGSLSRHGNIGPWSCGVVLAVTAFVSRGPGNTGSDVISQYQMTLYHGHALALIKFARLQRQIQVAREAIDAIYDAKKPVF